MNEFGEPNMGNPSVRFDEGRERVGHWPVCLFNPSAPAYSTLSNPIKATSQKPPLPSVLFDHCPVAHYSASYPVYAEYA
jgi:hypothetical protein